MNRETTNKIRFVLEDLLPPLLRDSVLFKWLAKAIWGDHIVALAEFRKNAPFLTDEEYEKLYRQHPRVHDLTDNSDACIRRIAEEVVGRSIIDVGCGTGYLLRRIMEIRGEEFDRVTGTDLIVPDAQEGIELVPAKIEKLPFADDAFDTVICTHVIEHILDYRTAIQELRRICRRKLIIVVPREREYRYTFNPHFNFFPYPESFLRAMQPVPADYSCEDINRDIFYCETRES
ncbi:methyltransferase domain-containing protein [Sneathiella chungangensis]|uniref:Methyltransferase domain-containing protein n=1 Tax=Sneathiella chungangensis TaxID=1418234 RepID=A0A845MMJ3_9PROT|nr:class I SAM-dependent methyltransferase [Sneathiella chungangensis]MZR24260.1 methyltransferase domain-containing protein [Sneathiella chungangensis]